MEWQVNMRVIDTESYNKNKGQVIDLSEERQRGDKDLTLAAPLQAAANVIPSAARFAGDLATVALNPIDTFNTATKLGASILSLVPGVKGDDTLAREVGKFYLDRYGGFGNIAKTLRDDPVGFAGDLSLLLAGGAGAARAAGKVNTLADTASRASRAIDPVLLAGRGANVAGRAIDAAGVNIIRGIQSAGSGVKPQVFEIAFRDGQLPRGQTTAFRRGFDRKKPVIDREIVDQAKASYKAKVKSRPNLPEIADRLKLENIRLNDETLKAVGDVLDDIKLSNRSTRTIESEKRLLNKVEKDIQIFFLNPTAQGLDDLIAKIGKRRPTSFSPGGTAGQPALDRVTGSLRQIFKDDKTQLPKEYIDAKKEYSRITDELEIIQKDLGLGTNVKDETILNNLKRTLAARDSIPEEALLLLDDGVNIRDTIAGVLARDIIPTQYLRTAGAAGTIGVPAVAGGAIAGLQGALLGGVGAGVLFSPRISTYTNVLAGRLRPRVGQFRESILEPIRPIVTQARPLGTIQSEVEDPLERRGLL